MGTQFKLTVTVNLSDGSEIDDIEVDDAVTVENIGDAAWETAAAEVRRCAAPGATIASLVIVAVAA